MKKVIWILVIALITGAIVSGAIYESNARKIMNRAYELSANENHYAARAAFQYVADKYPLSPQARKAMDEIHLITKELPSNRR